MFICQPYLNKAREKKRIKGGGSIWNLGVCWSDKGTYIPNPFFSGKTMNRNQKYCLRSGCGMCARCVWSWDVYIPPFERRQMFVLIICKGVSFGMKGSGTWELTRAAKEWGLHCAHSKHRPAVRAWFLKRVHRSTDTQSEVLNLSPFPPLVLRTVS